MQFNDIVDHGLQVSHFAPHALASIGLAWPSIAALTAKLPEGHLSLFNPERATFIIKHDVSFKLGF